MSRTLKASPVAALPALPPAAWKQSFRRRLLSWYRRHARQLPWRRTSDPYRIWVSEIMLQQTQVATVVDYYARFIAAFPNVRSLASAPRQEVLRYWEGLGYYTRARQLHRAAQIVVDEHGGTFPRQFEALSQLPGVGRYTAGAIASIAFNLPAPILEANTVRLLSRLLAYDGDVRGSTGQRLLWQMAGALLPRSNAGELNQALMELGSLICTPRSPSCALCPVRALCPTFAAGRQSSIPAPRAKARSEAAREAAIVIWRGKRVLLGLRPTGQRWAGLWDFPRFPLLARHAPAVRKELAAKVLDLAGVTIDPTGKLATIRHGVTRFRITLKCYTAQYVAGSHKTASGQQWKWLTLAELEKYPMSMTGRKLTRLLTQNDRA